MAREMPERSDRFDHSELMFFVSRRPPFATITHSDDIVPHRVQFNKSTNEQTVGELLCPDGRYPRYLLRRPP